MKRRYTRKVRRNKRRTLRRRKGGIRPPWYTEGKNGPYGGPDNSDLNVV
jgi:hypothetical protein